MPFLKKIIAWLIFKHPTKRYYTATYTLLLFLPCQLWVFLDGEKKNIDPSFDPSSPIMEWTFSLHLYTVKKGVRWERKINFSLELEMTVKGKDSYCASENCLSITIRLDSVKGRSMWKETGIIWHGPWQFTRPVLSFLLKQLFYFAIKSAVLAQAELKILLKIDYAKQMHCGTYLME